MDLLIDASALKDLACSRRFQFKILWGYRTEKSWYVKIGSAVHKLIELYSKGELDKFSIIQMMQFLSDRNLDPEKDSTPIKASLDAIRAHRMGEVVTDKDGVVGIEYRFLIKYATIDTTQVYLCGTIDRIEWVEDMPGVVTLDDWKSTSKPHQGIYTANDFAASLQLYFYLYVFKHYLKEKFPDVKGAFARIKAIHYNCFPGVVQPSSDVDLTPDIEAAIPLMLHDAVQKIINIDSLEEKIAYPEGLMYGECNRCDFWPVCQLKSEKEQKEYLHNNYKYKQYNPLKHGDE